MSINFYLIASHLVQFKELQMSNSSCLIAIAIAIANYQDKETFKKNPKKTISKNLF
jgi:hypothetical protein